MPKVRKPKNSSSDSDSGPEDRNPPPSKKAKESKESGKPNKADESGATEWTLEGMRQVRINEFRGRKMVDIREHYEKDGKVLPGKKGISLSATQWKKLLAVADEVTSALQE